jgi:TPP-dependent pyruvate/acetoin dehydrogenase alpha subunit
MDVGVKRNDLLADWLPKDPIARTRRELIDLGTPEPELNQIEADARNEVEHSVQLARLAPWPNPNTLHEHVFVAR